MDVFASDNGSIITLNIFYCTAYETPGSFTGNRRGRLEEGAAVKAYQKQDVFLATAPGQARRARPNSRLSKLRQRP